MHLMSNTGYLQEFQVIEAAVYTHMFKSQVAGQQVAKQPMKVELASSCRSKSADATLILAVCLC